MKKIKLASSVPCLLFLSVLSSSGATWAGGGDCAGLPSHSELTDALKMSVSASGGPENGGFDLNMWGTVVNRDGVVCAVTMTGNDRGDQWPGSRVISAQKANTANAFSLPGLALSTGHLWAATQPGGSLFGLQLSNPVDTAVAYGGPNHKGGSAKNYGMPNDPMVGSFIGGINVFGGGLALYNDDGVLVGGLGVSGDTSCADHNIAWRTRDGLELDNVPAGVGMPGDNIILDPTQGFGHPTCGGPGTAEGSISSDDVDDNFAVVAAHPLN